MVKKRSVPIEGIADEEWEAVKELARALAPTIGDFFINTIREAKREELAIAKRKLDAERELQSLKEAI